MSRSPFKRCPFLIKCHLRKKALKKSFEVGTDGFYSSNPAGGKIQYILQSVIKKSKNVYVLEVVILIS